MPLLNRLLSRDHCENIAITSGAASALQDLPNNLLVGRAKNILKTFWKPDGLVFIVGAMGAATRLVNSLTISKNLDPAVLVLDSKAKYVVPLIGGHRAGGEKLAFEIAADIGAQAIITSDSYTQERLALDSFGEGWGWIRSGSDNLWKEIMLQQAQGNSIDIEQFSGTNYWRNFSSNSNLIDSISIEKSSSKKISIGPFKNSNCSWHPPSIWIGIGCERNTTLNLLEKAIQASLDISNIAQESIAGLTTIDLKKDEASLLELSMARSWPIHFFSKEILSKIDVPNPSSQVKAAIGTPSVAESAALLASKQENLVLQKQTFNAEKPDEKGGVTIAIAAANNAFAPKRGELHLIGSGPGDIGFLTDDAKCALSRCVIWTGYSLYLDLLEPIKRFDQIRLDSQLTHERERCREALELAQQGIKVALISSGDSGIYGMAGLALQFWLEMEPFERPLFQVHPGISSFQLASARLGAPCMNDFCIISLSDNLTPWDVIKSRIEAAAKGDFVVAIYNPQSKSRDWQLSKAIDILLDYRKENTPSAIAKNLGRNAEEIEIFPLSKLPIEKVDMMTLVVIGNSTTMNEDGLIVTPRGY